MSCEEIAIPLLLDMTYSSVFFLHVTQANNRREMMVSEIKGE